VKNAISVADISAEPIIGTPLLLTHCKIHACFVYQLYYNPVVTCPPLSNIANGMMNCSLGVDGVPSFQDTCTFTCNQGFRLLGDVTRMCRSDESWSGTSASCMQSM